MRRFYPRKLPGGAYFCTVLFDPFSSFAIIFCFVPAVAVAIAGDPALAHLVEPQPERAARGELLPKRFRRALGILPCAGHPARSWCPVE